jgi:hypothetical protein
MGRLEFHQMLAVLEEVAAGELVITLAVLAVAVAGVEATSGIQAPLATLDRQVHHQQQTVLL